MTTYGRWADAQEVKAEPLQDTYIRHAVPDAIYGLDAVMLSGNVTIEDDWRTDALIQFELPEAPQGKSVEAARLELYMPHLEWANRGSAEFGVTAIMFKWLEDEDTWSTLDADFADYGEIVYDTAFIEGVDPPHGVREDLMPEEWVTWDVTQLAQSWYDGSIPNNGLAINGMLNWGDNSGAATFPRFSTIDSGDPEYFPALFISFGDSDPLAPLDDGTLTDPQERADYVHNVLNTWIGDANLDGEFNTNDLVVVLSACQYEDAVQGNSTWVTGDWNGDKEFNTSDLVVSLADGGYEFGPRAATLAVPEPSGAVVLWLGIVGVCRRRFSTARHSGRGVTSVE
jgi:hypothetical protein